MNYPVNIDCTLIEKADLYPDVQLAECTAGYRYMVAQCRPDRVNGYEPTCRYNGTADTLIRIGPGLVANVHALRQHSTGYGYGIRWLSKITGDQEWDRLCIDNNKTAES